ncbi:THAP domain-containing protein 6-like [Acyrthosiphon pisum]|uniref:THAP-type domain-containing protein n=1 Tax=Acyrthosiphon pisum TaxID=7029 RepID=A0A8R2H405_ACYPI|nr:THAP domain-containing protein 6-like [Acyrthosiphon pisum]|eukprot:XP_016657422.1 PREDICTED: THAP domain-containing protein 6-like [Acyrthosiphon pisum]
MGGCSAINCSHHSSKGHRVYIFPADETRRKLWLINCRRANWVPGRGAVLCEVHFEETEFELHRADGRVKLRPDAVPTLFNVPRPPKKHNPSPRKSLYKRLPEKEKMKSVSSETIRGKNLQHEDAANQSYENQFNPVKRKWKTFIN